MIKPDYVVPSMVEVHALKPNGFNVVSTFSGAGGSCLGYRMAGYKVLYSNEFIPEARETYLANCDRTTYLDDRDIRKVQPQDILDAIKLKVGEIDLFDGSPPCASFSTSGKREKGWKKQNEYSGTVQRTDDLFFEYARLLKALQPKVFVAENVKGLVTGSAKGYFLNILTELRSAGYNVQAQLLNAKWLGVPQRRERLIFVGVRNDLNLEPVHPKPFGYYYTLADALKSPVKLGESWPIPPGKMTDLYKATKPGDGFDTAYKRLYGKANMFSHKKAAFDQACLTIVQSSGIYHPIEPRQFSIPELKRIMSFPDDFVVTGNYQQQWERLGRAVPPVMMKSVAQSIADKILSHG
jgi:DNA (cytosine-5)-methyltransferase 1